MFELPQITLVAVTGKDYKTKEHFDALDYSTKGIKFGEVKLLQLSSITDIDSWNRAVIFELPNYIETEFALLIHADGYVVNPELWNDQWLNYDYIGAPWPLPKDDYSYRDEDGNLVRVGNSVSLRSKKLMDLIAKRPMDYHYGNNNEDGQICCWNRKWLESEGCKFAPISVAKYFSKEHEIEENRNIKTFAFHSI